MGRGRSYPAIGLREAIAKARELYEQDGNALTSPEVAVRAWGYSSLNGSSLRVLGALRGYGLLADTGDQTKLSDRALTILLEPEGSQERQKAIVDAADAPPIFQEILEHYSGNLPSDEAIKSHLVRREGFKDGPADILIASLRETRELVNGAARSYSTEEEPKRTEPPKRQERPVPPQVQHPPAEPGTLKIPLPVLDDGEAFLTLPRHMSGESFDTIVESLKTSLRVWRRAIVRDGNGSSGGDRGGPVEDGWPEEENDDRDGGGS